MVIYAWDFEMRCNLLSHIRHPQFYFCRYFIPVGGFHPSGFVKISGDSRGAHRPDWPRCSYPAKFMGGVLCKWSSRYRSWLCLPENCGQRISLSRDWTRFVFCIPGGRNRTLASSSSYITYGHCSWRCCHCSKTGYGADQYFYHDSLGHDNFRCPHSTFSSIGGVEKC